MNFAADRLSGERSSYRDRVRGGERDSCVDGDMDWGGKRRRRGDGRGNDHQRNSTDTVGEGKSEDEGNTNSGVISKNISKGSGIERCNVNDNAEGCIFDRTTHNMDHCKDEFVLECGNNARKSDKNARAIVGSDEAFECKEDGVGVELERGGVKGGEDDEAKEEETGENNDTFMQALISITRSLDERRDVSDNRWKRNMKTNAGGQHSPKKLEDKKVAYNGSTGGHAVSIRYKEARFIIGPPR